MILKIEKEFSIKHPYFREFLENPTYKKYWKQCLKAVEDKELLSHIIFCNNLFAIPPVKTFLTYYKKNL